MVDGEHVECQGHHGRWVVDGHLLHREEDDVLQEEVHSDLFLEDDMMAHVGQYDEGDDQDELLCEVLLSDQVQRIHLH